MIVSEVWKGLLHSSTKNNELSTNALAKACIEMSHKMIMHKITTSVVMWSLLYHSASSKAPVHPKLLKKSPTMAILLPAALSDIEMKLNTALSPRLEIS